MLAHNKTLAAQLCTEFREFFPDNAVEYFVSYYDYYQPEAYIPSTDTYIEKDSAINDEIDRLRHSATAALSERRDVIIVASVSCIYSLGDPIDYRSMVISLRPGMEMERDELCQQAGGPAIRAQRHQFYPQQVPCAGRHGGDLPGLYRATLAIRVEFFGDEIDRIFEINPVTGAKQKRVVNHVAIFPASHYIVSAERKAKALEKIRRGDATSRSSISPHEGKLIEAQRIEQRTNYDIEMLQEVGICKGIENYSRGAVGPCAGQYCPTTLLDYFPEDFLLFVDESHVTLPQVRGHVRRRLCPQENAGGVWLPPALGASTTARSNSRSWSRSSTRSMFVSATPGEYERKNSAQIARAGHPAHRPAGPADHRSRPVEGQVDRPAGRDQRPHGEKTNGSSSRP